MFLVRGDSPVAIARDACLLHERSTLALSVVNERQLVLLAASPWRGRVGRGSGVAKWAVRAGLALRRGGTRAAYAASVEYVLAGLLFGYAWVGAGKLSRATMRTRPR